MNDADYFLLQALENYSRASDPITKILMRHKVMRIVYRDNRESNKGILKWLINKSEEILEHYVIPKEDQSLRMCKFEEHAEIIVKQAIVELQRLPPEELFVMSL